MNILIVDDETVSVDSIAISLNWQALSIENVYKAYRLQQAQEVFLAHSVDILLCDIEMPKGNGIELIEWVRANGYDTICIFITCFSHFDYAFSAVRLQMFDYILKPCNYTKLAEVIQRAVLKRREMLAVREKELMVNYWNESIQERTNTFWYDLLAGNISSDADYLERELHGRHLSSSLINNSYHMLLLQALPDKEMYDWDENSWKYPIANVISELLNTSTVIVREKTFLAVVSEDSYLESDRFDQTCRKLVHTLCSIVPAEFQGHYALSVRLTNACAILQKITREVQEKYVLQSAVFQYNKIYTTCKAPDLSDERWETALLSGNSDLIVDDIQNALIPEPEQYIDRNLLFFLHHKLVSVISKVLEMNVSASSNHDGVNLTIQHDTFQSITDFIIWVQKITEQTGSLVHAKESSSSIISTVSQYIRDNINNELNRDELKKVAHLHPDYLSALFRQKTGLSISEYVTRERIREAKKLLLTSDFPIHEVAISTGFQNISYFSKQFKRLEGITPFQYRKNNRS